MTLYIWIRWCAVTGGGVGNKKIKKISKHFCHETLVVQLHTINKLRNGFVLERNDLLFSANRSMMQVSIRKVYDLQKWSLFCLFFFKTKKAVRLQSNSVLRFQIKNKKKFFEIFLIFLFQSEIGARMCACWRAHDKIGKVWSFSFPRNKKIMSLDIK